MADFDIIIRHGATKKNLFDRTRKAKLGSKISLVGELDVHENRIYVELHNFDFLSYNAIQTEASYTPSATTSSSSASERRNRLYESIMQTTNPSQPSKRHKTSDNKNPEEDSSSQMETNSNQSQNDTPQIKPPHTKSPRNPKQTATRELRSSQSVKKISDLAATNLNLPPFDQQE